MVLAFLIAAGIKHRAARRGWRAPLRDAAELVRAHLGTDCGAWATASLLLPGFTGSVPELLSTAVACVV